jgi:hypothetical protein
METTPEHHPMHATRSPRRRSLLRPVAVAALSLTLIGGLAACGSDDDAAAQEYPTTSGGRVPGVVEDGAYTGNPDATVPEEACDALAGLGAAMGAMPQDPEAIPAFVADEMVPLTTTLAEQLEGDAATAAATVDDAYQAMATSGDMSAVEDPAIADAQRTIGAAVHDGCDLAALDIEAIEYAFNDVPDTLPAGRYSFALENAGVEEHEMVLFRRSDDATETFEELSQLPEEEMMSKMAFTGVTFGGPGTTNYVVLDLEPGTYFLSCFIPVGGGEEGEPHFMKGMQETIEVS